MDGDSQLRDASSLAVHVASWLRDEEAASIAESSRKVLFEFRSEAWQQAGR